MLRTYAVSLSALPFRHSFANQLPVFFLWDHIYSRKKATGQDALHAVSTDPQVLEAAKDGWTAAMIEGGAHVSPFKYGRYYVRDTERHLTTLLVKYNGNVGDLRNVPIEVLEVLVLEFKRLHVKF